MAFACRTLSDFPDANLRKHSWIVRATFTKQRRHFQRERLAVVENLLLRVSRSFANVSTKDMIQDNQIQECLTQKVSATQLPSLHFFLLALTGCE